METFLKCCQSVGAFFHWLTGWLVHPKKGGCCEMDFETLKEKHGDKEK